MRFQNTFLKIRQNQLICLEFLEKNKSDLTKNVTPSLKLLKLLITSYASKGLEG